MSIQLQPLLVLIKLIIFYHYLKMILKCYNFLRHKQFNYLYAIKVLRTQYLAEQLT